MASKASTGQEKTVAAGAVEGLVMSHDIMLQFLLLSLRTVLCMFSKEEIT